MSKSDIAMSKSQTTTRSALTRLLHAAENVDEVEAGHEFELVAAMAEARAALNHANADRSDVFRALLRQVLDSPRAPAYVEFVYPGWCDRAKWALKNV